MRCFSWASFLSFVVITLFLFTLSYTGNEYARSVFYNSSLDNKDIRSRCMQLLPNERLTTTDWYRLFYHMNKETGKGIIWCKVPKAGSTSITRLFLKLAGVSSYETLNNLHIHKKLRSVYLREPKLLEITKEKLKDSFKFMVVRHPFERLLSAYRDKLENYQKELVHRNGRDYNVYGQYMSDYLPVDNLTRGPSWKQFVEYLVTTPVHMYNDHWQPMSQIRSPCGEVHFDAIFRLENVSQEIQAPLKSVGIQVPVGWTHKTKEGKLGKLDYFRQLTVKEVEKLYEIYKADFILFGYSPLKYFELATPN